MTGRRRAHGISFILISLACLAPAPSMAAQPETERNALIDLYQTTGGDNWHRSDGWLDAGMNHCDWFGVWCTSDDVVRRLELPDNHLAGPLPGSLSELTELKLLDLSGNALSGPVPPSFNSLNLERLDLADNQLEAGIAPAVAGMTLDGFIQLDVSRNDFNGPVPEELMALNPVQANIDSQLIAGTTADSDEWQPGLNLCWNDFEAPDSELATFIDQHHFGADFQNCQPERADIDPTVSGSRFNPERSGEGFVQHLLDNGQLLLFWFTQPLAIEHGEQAWFLRVTDPSERSMIFEGLQETQGIFGAGGTAELQEQFRMTVDRLADGGQRIAYSRGIDRGGSPAIRLFGLMSQSYDQIDLTRLAGTACDNQQPHQWISGAWYDPSRSGEGFVIDVNEDGRVVVYWFTYEPNDSLRQAWMIGTGEFDDGQVVIDEMIQPVGTHFGADFDSAEIELIDWGSLTLTFNNDSSGQITYESNLPEYGSGDYSIEPLARPRLADCSEAGDQS